MTQSTVAPDVSPDGHQPYPPHRPHRRRRWLWVVGAVGVLMAIVVGVIVGMFVLREDPGAKPLGEAVEEFRQEPDGPATLGEISRPEPGVYAATGAGQEAISFPPLSQDDGAIIPTTVQHESDGCWTFKVAYNEAHWQSWRYCPGDGPDTIVERGGQTFQRWDLGATSVENTSTFVCDPPALVLARDPVSGTTWDHACEGTNTQVSGTTLTEGPYTFVGEDRLQIGGEEVSAHHYRQSRTITGAQTGEQTVELWIEAESGLPLRSARSFEVGSDSPVGTITYTENGWWQLSSRRPTT